MMIQRSKNHSKNIITIGIGLLVGFAMAANAAVLVLPASAADADPQAQFCTDANKDGKIDFKDLDPQDPCAFPDEIKSTPDAAAKTCSGGDCSGLIKNYVNPLIKLLSALVGIFVVISIVVGGIMYGSAGGDPGKVTAAKKRIYNAILALLAYLFMFAFLQWLLPGGIV
ncbi:MAG: hypothetical protein AAB834_03965 [Patescibacteria group bacterium]